MRLRVGIQQHSHQNSSSSSSPSSNHFQLDPLDEDNSIFQSFFCCSSSSSTSSSSNPPGLMKFPFSTISENHLYRHHQFLSRPLFSLTSLSSSSSKRREVSSFFETLSPSFAKDPLNKAVFHLKEENRTSIMADKNPNAPIKFTASECQDDDSDDIKTSLDNKNTALLRPLHVSSCFDDTINGHNNIVDFLHHRLSIERQVKEHHEKSAKHNLFDDVLKNQEEITNSCASSSISMFFKILDFERRTLNMNNALETVDVDQIEGKSTVRESTRNILFIDDEEFINCTSDPVSPVMLKPIHYSLKINTNDSIQHHPFFINNVQSSSSLNLGKELSRTSTNLHLADFLLRRVNEPHIFDKIMEKHDGLSTKLFFSSSTKDQETKSLVFCEEEANRHDEFVDHEMKMTFENISKNVVNKDREELLDDIIINNNEKSSSLKLLHLVPPPFDHLALSSSTISKTLNKQQHEFYSSLSKQHESKMMKLIVENDSVNSSKNFFRGDCSETRPFDVLSRTRAFFCEHFDTNVSYSSSSNDESQEGNLLLTLRCFPHFSRIIHRKMSQLLFNHRTSPLASALDEEASDERMKPIKLFKLLKEVVQHSSNNRNFNKTTLTANSNFFDVLNRKYSINFNTNVFPHHADFTALSSSSMNQYIFQEDNSTSFLPSEETTDEKKKSGNTLVHHSNLDEEEELIELIVNPTLSHHQPSSISSSSATFIINPSHISREDLQLCSAKPWSRLFKSSVPNSSTSIFPFDSYSISNSLFSSLSTTIKIHALRFVKEHLVLTMMKKKTKSDNILLHQSSSSSSSSFILNIVDIFATYHQQKQTLDIFRVAALWSVLVSLILSQRDHFFGVAVEKNNLDEIEDELDDELDDDDDSASTSCQKDSRNTPNNNNINNEIWIAGSNFETCFALIGAVALFSKNTGSSFGISPSSSLSSEVSVKVLLQEELMHFNGNENSSEQEERKSPAIIVLVHDDNNKNHEDDEENYHHHLRMIHSCLRGKWGNSVKIVSMVFPVSSLSSSSSSSLSNNSKCLKQLDPIFMVHHQNLEKQRCISDRFLLSENPLSISISSSSSSSSYQTVRIYDNQPSSSSTTKTTKFAEIQNVLSAELSSLKNNNSSATIANFVCSSVVPFIFDHLETLIVMPMLDACEETRKKNTKQKVFIILDISNVTNNSSSSISQEWILPLRNTLQKNAHLQERFSVSVKSKSSCLAEFEKHATTKILSSSSSNTCTSNNNSSNTPTAIFLFETDDVSDSTSSSLFFENNFKDIVTILISGDLTKEDDEDDERNYSKKQNAKNANNVGCFGSALSSFLLVHPSSKNIEVKFSSKLYSVDKQERDDQGPLLSSDDEDY